MTRYMYIYILILTKLQSAHTSNEAVRGTSNTQNLGYDNIWHYWFIWFIATVHLQNVSFTHSTSPYFYCTGRLSPAPGTCFSTVMPCVSSPSPQPVVPDTVERFSSAWCWVLWCVCRPQTGPCPGGGGWGGIGEYTDSYSSASMTHNWQTLIFSFKQFFIVIVLIRY